MKSKTSIKVINRLFFTSLILFLAISFSFLPSLAGLARADSNPGYEFFWGHVKTTGGDTAANVQVTATVTGTQATQPIINTDAAGQYGGGNPGDVPLVLTGQTGQAIVFKVSGVTASITSVGAPSGDGWNWVPQDPPLSSYTFQATTEGLLIGIDLEYEPPPQPDTTPPNQITDLSVAGKTESSVTLTWTAPGDDDSTGAAAYYDVRYRTSGAVTEANWDSSSTAFGESYPQEAGQPETFTVNGLSDNTTYYFAVKAVDEANNYSLSNSVSGRTDIRDTTRPNAVTNLATSDATNSTIKLTWTAPGDDGNVGRAHNYLIRYRTGSAVNDDNWDAANAVIGVPAPADAGTVQTCVVTGLSAGTTYYFALKTQDEAGNTSPLSNSPSGITTSEDDSVAPAQIDDLAAGSPTSSSIELTWTATGDDENQGTATYYDIRYMSDNMVTEDNWGSALRITGPSPAEAGTPESFTVGGLAANTEYYFAIKAFDNGGNASPISNSPSATTASKSGGGGGGGGGGKDKTTTTTQTMTTTTTTTTTAPPSSTSTEATTTTTTTNTTPTTSKTTPTTPTTTTTKPGNPSQTSSPAFDTTNLVISKSSVAAGETVGISVDVTNSGAVSGTCEVTLVINKLTEGTRSVVLAAGETRTVNFSVTKSESGTYRVVVNGLEGTFKVIGAIRWALIAEIIGGVVVLGIVIFIIRRIITVNI